MPKNVQNKDTEDVFRLHLQKIKTIKMSPGQDLLLTIFISIWEIKIKFNKTFPFFKKT